MPLPWKKNKVSRLSRLMVDLQSPPKHGGSLVVQTGFPTSLVDLFVKNRDRLRKPSKKKLQSESHLEISKPVTLPAPQARDNVRTVNLTFRSEGNGQKKEITIAEVEDLVVVKEGDQGTVVRESERDQGERWKKRCVLMAVLRVFLVVVLALSTKRLAVGITMSAFLLLMLECVGTRVLFYLSTCSKATSYFVGKVAVLFFCKCKDDVGAPSLEETEICQEVSRRAIANDVGDSSVEEIHVVESKSIAVAPGEEIGRKEMNMEIVSGDGRETSLAMETEERVVHKNEDDGDVLVYEKEHRRKAKIKSSLVKKFVPKKLRSSKKDKKCKEKEMDSRSETGSCLDEDKFAGSDGYKQEHVDGDDLSRIRLVKEEERGKGHEEVDDRIASFSTQSQSEVEVITVEETVISESQGKSGYLILCLIVLAGLVGGRFLALVLTLAWCLMLKLARKLRPVRRISS